MISGVLFVVTMFLWFLTSLPHPSLAPFSGASNYFAFTAVLLLGLAFYVPGLRG
jgi:hypothetical protein